MLVYVCYYCDLIIWIWCNPQPIHTNPAATPQSTAHRPKVAITLFSSTLDSPTETALKALPGVSWIPMIEIVMELSIAFRSFPWLWTHINPSTVSSHHPEPTSKATLKYWTVTVMEKWLFKTYKISVPGISPPKYDNAIHI